MPETAVDDGENSMRIEKHLYCMGSKRGHKQREPQNDRKRSKCDITEKRLKPDGYRV